MSKRKTNNRKPIYTMKEEREIEKEQEDMINRSKKQEAIDMMKEEEKSQKEYT